MRRVVQIILLASVLFYSAGVFGQERDSFSAQLGGVSEVLLRERAAFRDFSAGSNVRALEDRYQQGMVLYTGGDFERASYIFMDIVMHEEWKGEPGYCSALLMLGKSLHEDSYYRLSQKYLLDAVGQCKGLERQDAIALLLNVVELTGDWDSVNALMDTLEGFGGDVIDYMRGRAYFLQDKSAEAESYLSRLGEVGEFAMKAKYLRGVILLEAGNLDEALEMFARCTLQGEKFRGYELVHDLCILAQARIYFERQEWSKAMDMYQQIGEGSPYFVDVLYEMAWTSLRRGEMEVAQQHLEVLSMSYPKSVYAAETKQLLADIERELGRYDSALAGYQEILNKYEPVMQQMREQSPSGEQHAESIRADIESGKFDEGMLIPKAAKDLVPAGGEAAQVESMISALGRSEDNTQSSREIIAEIEEILTGSARYSIFPEYRKFWEGARGIKMNLLRIGGEINEAVYAQAGQSTLREERVNLLGELSQIPQSAHERDVARVKRDVALSQRRAELYRLKLESDGMRHRMKIIESWLEEGNTKGVMESEREEIVERLSSLDNQLEGIEKRHKDLERSLNKLEGIDGLSDVTLRTEDEVISRLETVLDQEWVQMSSSSHADVHGQYGRLVQDANAYLREIDAGIETRLTGFRERLARESGVVSQEEQRYGSSVDELSQTVGDVAARYWNTVYGLVQNMVLGADLGMVDVAWLQKDERTQALSTMMEERKKDREVLEQDFKQFLKESGQEHSPAAGGKSAVSGGEVSGDTEAGSEAPVPGTEVE